MPTQITLGRLDTAASYAVQQFALPVLPDLPAIDLARQALKFASDKRQGVLFVGEVGAGKSLALKLAVQEVEAEQVELLNLNPATHRVQRILAVHRLDAKTPREVLVSLLKRVSPNVRERERGGGRKGDDTLRDELVQGLLTKNITVIVADELDDLQDAPLYELRKILSAAQSADPRWVRAGGAHGGAEVEAAGVGIIASSTPAIDARILKTGDDSGRWANRVPVPLPSPTLLPSIYARIFPAFAAHVDAVGAEAWAQFIALHVARGRALDMRIVENHCRDYYALMVDAALTAGQPVPSRESTMFCRERFLYALTQIDWADGLKSAGRRRA